MPGFLVAFALACAAYLPCAQSHRPHDVIQSVAVSADGLTVLVLIRQMLYRSSDGGYNWHMADKGLPLTMGNEHIIPTSDGKNRTTMVSPDMQIVLSPNLENDKTAFLVDHQHGLFRSTDAGLSWENPQQGKMYLPPSVRESADALTVSVAVSTDYHRDSTVVIGMSSHTVDSQG